MKITIDPKYISKTCAQHAVDAISKIPGVAHFTTGQNVSKPFIRGLGSNRILTAYDEQQQEGQQ